MVEQDVPKRIPPAPAHAGPYRKRVDKVRHRWKWVLSLSHDQAAAESGKDKGPPPVHTQQLEAQLHYVQAVPNHVAGLRRHERADSGVSAAMRQRTDVKITCALNNNSGSSRQVSYLSSHCRNHCGNLRCRRCSLRKRSGVRLPSCLKVQQGQVPSMWEGSMLRAVMNNASHARRRIVNNSAWSLFRPT